MERTHSVDPGTRPMTHPAHFEPGEKTHKDENFPVASYLIDKKYRSAILAFYRFARAADDVADDPALSEKEKLTRLDQFEATLLGKNDSVSEAIALREIINAHHLSMRHACDLLIAFRQDASKSRYKDWNDLMQYCAYSANPVGRFVLDVHGENPSTWAASDALCSALQIINHLQDCKADYLRLNRVYIPQDMLALYAVSDTALAEPKASPGMRHCLTELVDKTQLLIAPQRLSLHIKNRRLGMEVLMIEKLARRLLNLLRARDPLSERVHLNKLQVISILLDTIFTATLARAFTPNA